MKAAAEGLYTFEMAGMLVGRDPELALGDRFLDALASGFHCLVFEGEPGIGKTTLWRETSHRAAERGFRVLSSRAAPSETKLSFAGLADLLATVPETVLDDLPPPQRRALDVALVREAPRGTHPDERAIAAASLSVVRMLSVDRPLLLAIDDCPWLDQPSSAALEFVVRRLDREPVGLVSSLRVGEPRDETFLTAVEATRATSVRVGPLRAGDLHLMLKQRLDATFPRPTLARIDQACRGNPLYALELARELLRSPVRPGDVLPVPDDVRTLVSDRIRAFPKATRDALLAASALTNPTVRLVDETALEPAEEAGVVRIQPDGHIEFEHPLFAAAVYSAASSASRRNLHRRLGDLVDDVEERARHVALAATDPDAAVAAAVEDGASSARSRGAPEIAAELMARAVDLTPPTDTATRLRRIVQLAEDHLFSGDKARPRELIETAALPHLTAGQTRAKALRVLAQCRYRHDSWTDAGPLLEQALAEVESDEERALIEFHLAWAFAVAGDNETSNRHARAAFADAARTGQHALCGRALAGAAWTDFVLGRPVDNAVLKRAIELDDWTTRAWVSSRALFSATWCWYFSGDIPRAAAASAELREQVIAAGQEDSLPDIALQAVFISLANGEFERAAQHADETIAITAGLESAALRGVALLTRATASAHLGLVEETKAAAEEASAIFEEVGWLQMSPFVPATLGFLALSTGDANTTHELLGPLADFVQAVGIGEPTFTAPFLPDEIEALIGIGELDRAAELIDLLEAAGRRVDRAWALAAAARCRGLLAAARGDQDEALSALDEALEHHRRLDNPFELGRTLLRLGQVQRRAKQRRSARESLSRACEIFETAGARLWAEQARRELGRIGVRRAPTQLTTSEQAVAELAAQGLTNHEIATQLFMSQRTVEANLTRIYRKLGATRAELGVMIARGEAF